MNVWKTRHYTSDRGGQPTANSKSLVQRQRRTDESATTKWAESVTRHKKLVTTGRAQSLSTGDVRGWRNTISQVLRGLVLLTPAHCYAELVLHTFWNVQPVQVEYCRYLEISIGVAHGHRKCNCKYNYICYRFRADRCWTYRDGDFEVRCGLLEIIENGIIVKLG